MVARRLASVLAKPAALVVAVLVGVATQPGTAAQVSALVVASHGITKVSERVAAELSSAANDWWTVPYPNAQNCKTAKACAFGDVESDRVVVLFGDSHAAMWLPALVPEAKRLHFRLVLIFKELCPPSELDSFSYSGEPMTPGCLAFRSASIAAIRELKPVLVLIGEQTAEVYATQRKQRFSSHQWATALRATIVQLQSRSTNVAVLEDVTFFDKIPATCLAAVPTNVQRSCSVRYPNPRYPSQVMAEAAATSATHATLIRTAPWLCRATCSPVIGDFVPFVDQSHISAAYAAFLATVVGTAIRPLL